LSVNYKIINDPVHGFITVAHPLIRELIEHPFFQRLRYITQMGLSYLVFPGAHHTRWQHALGAMHLMHRAVEVLRSKGIRIDEAEKEAALAAILLHDIGHGPFSHALEYAIIRHTDHEQISAVLMDYLNEETDGRLELAISLFRNRHPKQFLHDLISSQLDTDRLDYLQRDSFFTGVVEGRINAGRLIEMMNVADNRLTVDEKGLYSVEKFIFSRRFMYWQVYLHKTSLMFEKVLEQTLRRAKRIRQLGHPMYLDDDLGYFFDRDSAPFDPGAVRRFTRLTDADILIHLKKWTAHPDKVLSFLSRTIVKRRPMQIELSKEPFDEAYMARVRERTRRALELTEEETDYLVLAGEISHTAYDPRHHPIIIRTKDGGLREFSELTDHLYIRALSRKVRKYYLIYPKNL